MKSKTRTYIIHDNSRFSLLSVEPMGLDKLETEIRGRFGHLMFPPKFALRIIGGRALLAPIDKTRRGLEITHTNFITKEIAKKVLKLLEESP